MNALVAALTVGVGIHLMVVVFLLLRYLDGRDRLYGWWSVAYGFFAAHVFVEAVLAMGAPDGWFALRHLFFIAAAWAMVYSLRPVWWVTAGSAAVAIIAAILQPVSWLAAALVASVGGGTGFIAAAWLLYVHEGGLPSRSSRLLFWGLLLTGVHALGYPVLRPHPQLATVGAAFSGIFTLAFGIGIALRAWQRTQELTRLYEELQEKELQRGRLLEKLISAHEDERRRIARELHDEAGQALTALIVNLEMAEQSGSAVEAQRLTKLREIAEGTLAELRRLIYDLRPTILDDLGLAAAVRWYVREHVEPQGLAVAMTITGADERLPRHIETAVFRIVQEALTNILKHAGARHASIEVAVTRQQARVVIADDGHGFDLSAVTIRRDGGMGLLGMRERAELLGGALRLESRDGAGTRVEAVIPVELSVDGQD
jgi:signal transduction histidine kinase